MRNGLLAIVLILVIISARITADSAEETSDVSGVDSMDTSSCSDFTHFPVIEIILTPSLLPGESIRAEELASIREQIVRRLEALGVNSAIVETQDSQRIVVDLFMTDQLRDKDIQRIIDIVNTTGVLEIVDPNSQYLPAGSFVKTSRDPNGLPGTSEDIAGPVYTTILSDSDFQEFFPTMNSLGQMVIGFRLTSDAANKFYNFTSTHIGQPISITIDKQVISSPRIDAAISSEGIISGLLASQTDNLVVILNSGPLSVPVAVVGSSDSSSLCSS